MPKHSEMVFRIFSVHAMEYQEKPEKIVRGKNSSSLFFSGNSVSLVIHQVTEILV